MNKEKIFSYLQKQQLAVVATSSLLGKPDAAVVAYSIDSDWNIYFFTHDDTEKIKNLNINKRVALVIGTVLGPNTVQIDGHAELIRPGTDHFEDMLIEFGKSEQFNKSPFLKFRKVNVVLVKVVIKKLRYLDINLETGKEEYTTITL